jgi:hypothetical protein
VIRHSGVNLIDGSHAADVPFRAVRELPASRQAGTDLDNFTRSGAVSFPAPKTFRVVRIYEVKGWKWAGDTRVLACIIAALVFMIWIALQQVYY